MEKELASASSTAAVMQTEKSQLQQELQESKKEQDDLLMLLADQDQKILSLKHRLKGLGETVRSTGFLGGRSKLLGLILGLHLTFPFRLKMRMIWMRGTSLTMMMMMMMKKSVMNKKH